MLNISCKVTAAIKLDLKKKKKLWCKISYMKWLDIKNDGTQEAWQ